MDFNELIQGFAKRFGIPALVPDDLGSYEIEIDDMVVKIHHLSEDDLVEISAEVCKVADKVRDSLFQLMMEGMFMGNATCGNAFVYDEETKCVYMRRTDCLSALDATDFNGIVEKFVNVLEEWRILVSGLADIIDTVGEAKSKMMSVSQLLSLNGLSV